MINERMYELGSRRSVIRELFEFGRKRAAEIGEENVFDFSIGNPNVPAPDEVNQTAERLLDTLPSPAAHGYTSAQGDAEVRSSIASYIEQAFSFPARASELYLTVGAAAAVTITVRAVTSSPDDEVIVLAPFFTEYSVFVGNAGAKLVVVPPRKPDFGINFEGLEKAITSNTRALIIDSPNNPTGVIYTEDELKRLGRLLTEEEKEFGGAIYLISDEPYRDITYGKDVPYVPKYYPDTVVCYSYSKSLSLPGERIGYIFVPTQAYDAPKLYAAVAGAGRSMGYVCAPSLFQKVIGKCQGLTSDLSVYSTNRDLLLVMLREIGYECVEPDGAFYLFVKALEDDANAFSERAKKFDLLLVPSDDFGCPGYVRIAYCTSTDKIRRSRTAFEKLFADYRK